MRARHLRLGVSRARKRAVGAMRGEGWRWYEAGLRFDCTGCGRCCTGGSGYVWVTADDVSRLADALGLDLDGFGRRYLRRVGERYALLEAPRDGACVFLEADRCSVYAARPSQCRRFPFWESHLASPAAWIAAARECEGIRDEAPLVSREEIDARRRE